MIHKTILAISVQLLIAFFTPVNCYAVSVGDIVGGGTAFCVSQTSDTSLCSTADGSSGQYALIMANVDQANALINPPEGITWSTAYGTTGASSVSNGAANTATIIAYYPGDNSSNNAAWACHNYLGGGYGDWYLPSKDELNYMYLYVSAHNLIGSNCSGSVIDGAQCLVGGV